MDDKGRIERTTEFRLAKDTDCTVLILGPTGAGKSHLAEKVHRLSRRSSAQFVAVHLSSLHEGTLESQLFGHERGAFTGASSRQMGWLQKAQGGTLFLDEIAELSLSAQARLLEFLHTKRISPLGSRASIQLDVRIICATNKDLRLEVRRGTFREDLYHRMKVVTIDLPPLRESLEALDEVVHDLITDLSTLHLRRLCRIESKVAELLESYSWPGNYRELRNVLEFAVLASRDGVIRETDLPEWFMATAREERLRLREYLSAEDAVIERIPGVDSESVQSIAKIVLKEDYESTMRNFERAYLRHALQTCQGHLTRTALQLKLPKSTLSRRARALGLGRQGPEI